METMTEKPATVESRVAQDVAKFNPAEAKLATFREYLTYRINGIADKDGQKMVSTARKEVKAERVALEKLLKAYCAALLAIPQPEMKSKAGAEKVAAIATKLEEITTL